MELFIVGLFLYSFVFYVFLILIIGDFTGYSKALFPYIIAAQEDQTIYSRECVPEGFVLSDPDHLKGFEIDDLYNHWLKRQSQGLVPLVILNSIPQHGVSKKKSEKARGKKKMDYVDVNTDDDEVRSEAENSGGEEEMSGVEEQTDRSPAFKIGPPSGKRSQMVDDNATCEAGSSTNRQVNKPKKSKDPKPVNVPAEKSGKTLPRTSKTGLRKQVSI